MNSEVPIDSAESRYLVLLLNDSSIGPWFAFLQTTMKTVMISKEVLDNVLFEVLRVKIGAWPLVSGHEDKKKRRVAIWAYHFYLGARLTALQQVFGIQSPQSLRKMLGKKNLCEEEYNWRRMLMKKIEARLTIYRPIDVAAA